MEDSIDFRIVAVNKNDQFEIKLTLTLTNMSSDGVLVPATLSNPSIASCHHLHCNLLDEIVLIDSTSGSPCVDDVHRWRSSHCHFDNNKQVPEVVLPALQSRAYEVYLQRSKIPLPGTYKLRFATDLPKTRLNLFTNWIEIRGGERKVVNQ